MLSTEFQEFIRGCIRSVWAVELLLVLRRGRDRAFTADELVRELRASAALVAENLECFLATGLTREIAPGQYRYDPASPVLDRLCDRLEQEYRLRPVTVINAIVAGQRTAVQRLADAFRLKGDDR